MKPIVLKIALAWGLLLALPIGVMAEVHLPNVFGSHMVLQQEKPVMIWGWASPGEAIKVQVADSVANATANAIANDKGEWKAQLPAMKAGGPAVTLTITSTADASAKPIVFDDILIGEVWLASGQSNMEFGLGNAIDGKREIAAADQPEIRLLKVGKTWKPQPQKDIAGQWKVCTPESVASGGWNGFSAVAYFYGVELHQKLGVPIGLIDATWGGTRIESWTPPQGFAQVPALKSDNDKLQLAIPGSPAHDQKLNQLIDSMNAWSTAAKQSIADKTFPPPLPIAPAGLAGPADVQSATALFNGMISPLCPLSIRGAIWYQGEANHNEGLLYTERMKALIGGWRTIWGEGDFPFYFVQIAPFNYGDKKPFLPEFWEAQGAAEKNIPNTGMIVVNDIADLKDIHPKNKKDVGHRLASRALVDTYGKQDVIGHSPTFKSMKADGATLRVTFDHTAAGLVSRDGNPIKLFEIADAETGIYSSAVATLDGDSVILKSDKVKNPVAVRFAWDMLAEPNLSNSAGFPASAFRSGSVPLIDSVLPNVPELRDYQLVYEADLTTLAADIHYAKDNHAAITKPFDRIAYAVELQDAQGHRQWVCASMDAFTDNLAKIGIPTLASGASFQQNINNLNVFSNVDSIVTGRSLTGGNIEFWPNNYGAPNQLKVANASDEKYDFGDQISDPVDGYGSMQIHNHDAKQTLFAINHWRAAETADLGIGNAPTGNPDWTFANNANTYTTGRLRVFVRSK